MNQNMVIFDENSFRQGIEKIKENKKNIITLFNEENLDMEKINNVDVWYSETSQNVLSKYQELQQNYESIEDSLNNVKQKENIQNNYNNDDRPMGGCPVFMNKFKEINIKFEPKYPINFMINTYDYIFDKLNYENSEKYMQSKKIRSYPLHLRNTLFIRDEKVKRVRKMDFEQSYIIGEEMKEKINKVKIEKILY